MTLGMTLVMTLGTTLGMTMCIKPDMTLGMTKNMTLGMTLGMTYLYLHFWHMYLPSAVALTLSLHSWHKARPKTRKRKKIYFKTSKLFEILFEILFNIYFLPWFFMKPKSANSLWHISQQKHLGCQDAIIALMTLPTINSPEIYLKKYLNGF